MLVLKCANTETSIFASRLAVLDIPNSRKIDFALVTGHALPLQRPCYVQDFNGNQEDVDLIDYANGFEVSTRKDWAIISFPKMKTKGLVRYPLVPITDYITDFEAADILFAQARGLPDNTQSCKLIEIQRNDEHKTANSKEDKYALFHNCYSIPGQSGSPLTTQVKGRDYLVGLHIGRAWFFKSPYTGRADRHGYIALLDAPMVDDVHRIIHKN